jgi:hypothetical protein
VQVATRFIIAKLRNRHFFSLAALNAAIEELGTQINNRAPSWRQPPGAVRGAGAVGAQAAAGRVLRLCRMEGMPGRARLSRRNREALLLGAAPVATREGVGSITARTVEIFHRGNRVAAHVRSSSNRKHTTCASTCCRATLGMPTGRRSASGARPARSAATLQHWSRSSCGSGRTPNRAFAPAPSFCGSPRLMVASGSKPPVAERSRSVRAPTARLTRSSKTASIANGLPCPRTGLR